MGVGRENGRIRPTLALLPDIIYLLFDDIYIY
jgi:hypothetical protein